MPVSFCLYLLHEKSFVERNADAMNLFYELNNFNFFFIVLAMQWLFTTYNVMSRNVTAKKWLVTTFNGQKCFVAVTKCDITL